MNPEIIVKEKAEKYYCSFDDIQMKAILEAIGQCLNGNIKILTTDEFKVETIIKKVGYIYSLPFDYNIDKTRKREFVLARHISMYFSKKLTKLSLAKIGSFFGNKDHATVKHAVKTINNLMDTDKKFKEDIQNLETEFKKINK